MADFRPGLIALANSEIKILSQSADLLAGRLKSARLLRFVAFQVLGEGLQAADFRLRFVSLDRSDVEILTESVSLFRGRLSSGRVLGLELLKLQIQILILVGGRLKQRV